MSILIITAIVIALFCVASITDYREKKKDIHSVNADILSIAVKDKNNSLGIYNYNMPLKHHDAIEIGRTPEMTILYYFPADYFTFKRRKSDTYTQYCINRHTLMGLLEKYTVDEFIDTFTHKAQLQ